MKMLGSLTIAIALYIAGCETPQEDTLIREKANDTTQNNDTLATVDTCIADTCNTCELSPKADTIYNQLLEAYNDSCVNCLQEILDEWANAYSARTDIPDSLLKVYDVYKKFYSPWDLARISNSEFGPRIYESISYYVIQASVRYDYKFNYPDYETFDFPDGSEYTIHDFRPALANDTIKSLYLTDAYKSAINCFLGSDHTPFSNQNIMSPALPAGESESRNTFLNNYLLFIHGHWGGYWHLTTHPEVSTISFNETADSAQVRFRLIYQGGEAILTKKGEGWEVVDHYMTWIE